MARGSGEELNRTSYTSTGKRGEKNCTSKTAEGRSFHKKENLETTQETKQAVTFGDNEDKGANGRTEDSQNLEGL